MHGAHDAFRDVGKGGPANCADTEPARIPDPDQKQVFLPEQAQAIEQIFIGLRI